MLIDPKADPKPTMPFVLVAAVTFLALFTQSVSGFGFGLVSMALLPGALDAVQTTASAYRAALASGSPPQVIDKVMSMTGLNRVFEFIVYADDMSNGKPAPDVYLETARRLGLKSADCVGIEDSGNGLRALKAAGMYAIAVPSPGFPLPNDLLALADRVLPS